LNHHNCLHLPEDRIVDLSLRYKDDGTEHDDLCLCFAGQTQVCDSYYFAIDRGMRPDEESPAKVKAVLHRLLEQWLTTVANLPEGGTAFLPYDFSDQGTGWLRCERAGNEIVMSQGWSKVPGHSVFPSTVGDYLSNLPDFHVDGPTTKSSREDLQQAIRASLPEEA
jgi:hypothetical protein